MKNARTYLLLLCIVILGKPLFANEGIDFQTGTWEEILEKAKKEDKLVFVDFYTAWCQPCKLMDVDIFPLKGVGDIFNASFVNYKIDAEKKEGPKIAVQYGVGLYPTFLFINGDGKVIYRSGGYMDSSSLVQSAKAALKEQHEPRPIASWEQEYNEGNRSKDFLLSYITKRRGMSLSNSSLLEEVLPLMAPEERLDKNFLKIILGSQDALIPGAAVYEYILTHYDEIDSVFGNIRGGGSTLSNLTAGLNYYFEQIVQQKNEDKLPILLAAKGRLLELKGQTDNKDAALKGIVMNYYNRTGNQKKLIPSVLDYVNNGLLKLDITGRIAADRNEFQKYLDGTLDSTKVQEWEIMRRIYKNNKMIFISTGLADAARIIYNTGTSNPKLVKQALGWAKSAEEYYPLYSNKAIYAGFLFKLGQKQLAYEIMMAASEDGFIKNRENTRLSLIKKAEAMKNGEAPKAL